MAIRNFVREPSWASVMRSRARGWPPHALFPAVQAVDVFRGVVELDVADSAASFEDHAVLDDELGRLDVTEHARGGQEEDPAGGGNSADNDPLHDHTGRDDVRLHPSLGPYLELIHEERLALESAVDAQAPADRELSLEERFFTDGGVGFNIDLQSLSPGADPGAR